MDKQFVIQDFDKFTRAYLVCALWSSSDTCSKNERDDRSFSDLGLNLMDCSENFLQNTLKDCTKFQEKHWDVICCDPEQAGHDFWLSRNRHGSGFFDGDWDGHEAALQDSAEGYGELSLYLDEDGVIQVC